MHCTIETFIYTENRLPPTLEFIHYTKYLINTVFLSKCHHGMMQDEAHKSLINHDPRLKEEQYPVIVIGCQWLLWWTTFYRKKTPVIFLVCIASNHGFDWQSDTVRMSMLQ